MGNEGIDMKSQMHRRRGRKNSVEERKVRRNGERWIVGTKEGKKCNRERKEYSWLEGQWVIEGENSNYKSGRKSYWRVAWKWEGITKRSSRRKEKWEIVAWWWEISCWII